MQAVLFGRLKEHAQQAAGLITQRHRDIVFAKAKNGTTLLPSSCKGTRQHCQITGMKLRCYDPFHHDIIGREQQGASHIRLQGDALTSTDQLSSESTHGRSSTAAPLAK
jgi:hypothetical protein